MIRIALCDDDQNNLLDLSKKIRAYQQTQPVNFEMTIEVYDNGLDLISALKRGSHYDLIFLDIMMPLADGMEIAKEIRQFNTVVKIIFLTSTPQYALESYDVKAYSYLLKSDTQEKLYAVLSDALGEIERVADHCLVLKTKTGLVKLRYDGIEYVEVYGKDILIQMANTQTHELFGTLTELEGALLEQENFIKPHRSYLVNMDYVRKLQEKELKTINGYTIPISRANYPEVKKQYLAYSFKHGD